MVRPWQIVYPALFFSGIFAFILLGSTTQLTKGFYNFCSQLEVDHGAGYVICKNVLFDFLSFTRGNHISHISNTSKGHKLLHWFLSLLHNM